MIIMAIMTNMVIADHHGHRDHQGHHRDGDHRDHHGHHDHHHGDDGDYKYSARKVLNHSLLAGGRPCQYSPQISSNTFSIILF